MDDKFYTVDGVEAISADISVGLIDAFKYLINCKILGTNPEDAALLTPELLEAFDDVAGSCKDFISAYEYYTNEENQKKILDIYNNA